MIEFIDIDITKRIYTTQSIELITLHHLLYIYVST
jgi:hypothetical protein